MRRLKQYLYFKYFQWKIRRWQKDIELLFKYGNVRQLRELAEGFKKVGRETGTPDYERLGFTLDAYAERIVLRRIGFKR